MLEQNGHKITQSFLMWYDHTLLDDGQAYKNVTSQLYPQTDPRIANYYKYASPHKQWVVDGAVSGAEIPSGVYIGTDFHPFSGDAIFADWNNGRVLMQTEATGTVSATYATKELNSYVTNQTEEKLIFQNRYNVNNFYTVPASGISPYDQAIPASFFINTNTDGSCYALGSSDFQKDTYRFRSIVMTNNMMHLDGALSLFREKVDKCFKMVSITEDQFNGYGGLKSSYSGNYNYDNLTSNKEGLVFIDKVTTSKLFQGSNEFFPQSLQVGFINFDLSFFRTPN